MKSTFIRMWVNPACRPTLEVSAFVLAQSNGNIYHPCPVCGKVHEVGFNDSSVFTFKQESIMQSQLNKEHGGRE